MMNQFSIKDIENLSGIKAHTWRIWEQRYFLGIAQRKESNHRYFDYENLKLILRISYLYHHGIKISKIAALSSEEMKALALAKLPKKDEEFYINELIESSLDLDQEKFEQIFNDAAEKMGFEETVLKIINPFQEKTGMLWLTDRLIPSQEHFTSYIIRQKLTIAIENLPFIKTTEKKKILLFTPKTERHDLTLLFIFYLLKKNKNKVIFFGRNTALDSIKMFEEKNSFGYLFFHFVINLTNISVDEYLKEVSLLFPDKQIVMAGVQVSNVTETPANVRLLKSMDEVISFTEE